MGGKLITNEFEKGMEVEIQTEENESIKSRNVVRTFQKTEYPSDNLNKISTFSDKCIIIKIRDKYPSVYERVRRCWKNQKERAEQADYVLAVINGRVEGVFEPTQWYYIPIEECRKNVCESKTQSCGRIGFIGKEAGDEVQKKYFNKYIPDWYMRPGPGPVQYTY